MRDMSALLRQVRTPDRILRLFTAARRVGANNDDERAEARRAKRIQFETEDALGIEPPFSG